MIGYWVKTRSILGPAAIMQGIRARRASGRPPVLAPTIGSVPKTGRPRRSVATSRHGKALAEPVAGRQRARAPLPERVPPSLFFLRRVLGLSLAFRRRELVQ